MTKRDFEKKLGDIPIDRELWFRFPEGWEIQIRQVHKEDKLVLGASVLGMSIMFRAYGQMLVKGDYYNASEDTEMIFRYNGKTYIFNEIIEDGKRAILV